MYNFIGNALEKGTIFAELDANCMRAGLCVILSTEEQFEKTCCLIQDMAGTEYVDVDIVH